MANPIVRGYSINDFYYSDASLCSNANDQECIKNKLVSTTLMQNQAQLSGAKKKYEDVKQLYNRELIFTINLLIGVGLLIYYVYINEDVLPELPKMPEMPKMSEISGMIPKLQT